MEEDDKVQTNSLFDKKVGIRKAPKSNPNNKTAREIEIEELQDTIKLRPSSGISINSIDPEKVNLEEFKSYVDLDLVKNTDLDNLGSLRAQEQHWTEQTWRGITNTLPGFVGEIVTDVGTLGAIVKEGIFGYTVDNPYTNDITAFGEMINGLKRDVYQQSPGTSDFSDYAYWVNNISDGVASVGAFMAVEAVTGGVGGAMARGASVTGKALSRAAKVAAGTSKGLELSVKMANKAALLSSKTIKGYNAIKFVPKLSEVANAAVLSSAEAGRTGAQVYDAAIEKMAGVEGISEEDKLEIATQAAHTSVMLGTALGMVTNLVPLTATRMTTSSILKKQKNLLKLKNKGIKGATETTEQYVKRLKASGVSDDVIRKELKKAVNKEVGIRSYPKEMLSEAFEEAMLEGAAEVGSAQVDKEVNKLTGNSPDIDNLTYLDAWFKGSTSKEGLEAAFWGAFMGGALKAGRERGTPNRTNKYDENGIIYQEVKNADGTVTKKPVKEWKFGTAKGLRTKAEEDYEKYRNTIIKDIDFVKKSYQDMAEAAQNGGMTKDGRSLDEVKQDLFDMTKFNSVTQGFSENIEQTLGEANQMSNTNDLGEEYKKDLDEVLKSIDKLKGEGEAAGGLSEKQSEMLISMEEQAKIIEDNIVKYSGKSSAMAAGYAQAKDSDGNLDDFKEVNNEFISELKATREQYEVLKSKFDSSSDEVYQYPEKILDIWINNKRFAKLNKKMQKQIENDDTNSDPLTKEATDYVTSVLYDEVYKEGLEGMDSEFSNKAAKENRPKESKGVMYNAIESLKTLLSASEETQQQYIDELYKQKKEPKIVDGVDVNREYNQVIDDKLLSFHSSLKNNRESNKKIPSNLKEKINKAIWFGSQREKNVHTTIDNVKKELDNQKKVLAGYEKKEHSKLEKVGTEKSIEYLEEVLKRKRLDIEQSLIDEIEDDVDKIEFDNKFPPEILRELKENIRSLRNISNGKNNVIQKASDKIYQKQLQVAEDYAFNQYAYFTSNQGSSTLKASLKKRAELERKEFKDAKLKMARSQLAELTNLANLKKRKVEKQKKANEEKDAKNKKKVIEKKDNIDKKVIPTPPKPLDLNKDGKHKGTESFNKLRLEKFIASKDASQTSISKIFEVGLTDVDIKTKLEKDGVIENDKFVMALDDIIQLYGFQDDGDGSTYLSDDDALQELTGDNNRHKIITHLFRANPMDTRGSVFTATIKDADGNSVQVKGAVGNLLLWISEFKDGKIIPNSIDRNSDLFKYFVHLASSIKDSEQLDFKDGMPVEDQKGILADILSVMDQMTLVKALSDSKAGNDVPFNMITTLLKEKLGKYGVNAMSYTDFIDNRTDTNNSISTTLKDIDGGKLYSSSTVESSNILDSVDMFNSIGKFIKDNGFTSSDLVRGHKDAIDKIVELYEKASGFNSLIQSEDNQLETLNRLIKHVNSYFNALAEANKADVDFSANELRPKGNELEVVNVDTEVLEGDSLELANQVTTPKKSELSKPAVLRMDGMAIARASHVWDVNNLTLIDVSKDGVPTESKHLIKVGETLEIVADVGYKGKLFDWSNKEGELQRKTIEDSWENYSRKKAKEKGTEGEAWISNNMPIAIYKVVYVDGVKVRELIGYVPTLDAVNYLTVGDNKENNLAEQQGRVRELRTILANTETEEDGTYINKMLEVVDKGTGHLNTSQSGEMKPLSDVFKDEQSTPKFFDIALVTDKGIMGSNGEIHETGDDSQFLSDFKGRTAIVLKAPNGEKVRRFIIKNSIAEVNDGKALDAVMAGMDEILKGNNAKNHINTISNLIVVDKKKKSDAIIAADNISGRPSIVYMDKDGDGNVTGIHLFNQAKVGTGMSLTEDSTEEEKQAFKEALGKVPINTSDKLLGLNKLGTKRGESRIPTGHTTTASGIRYQYASGTYKDFLFKNIKTDLESKTIKSKMYKTDKEFDNDNLPEDVHSDGAGGHVEVSYFNNSVTSFELVNIDNTPKSTTVPNAFNLSFSSATTVIDVKGFNNTPNKNKTEC